MESSGISQTTPSRPLPATALVLLAALIPGVGALSGPFFYMDDRQMIHENRLVTGPLSWRLFTEPHFSHYAPLHELLLWLQWHLFGDAPVGFRIVSLLLHAAAAWACLVMLRNLTQRADLSLGAALLWAVHPIQSESVAWIVEQKTLWCGLFCFLSLAVYFDTQRSRVQRTFLGVALMILAGLGKSPALIVGPLVLLYELFSFRAGSWIARALSTLPFLLVSALFARLALWANSYSEGIAHWTLLDTLLHLPGALLIYLRVAFLPWTVSFFEQLSRVTSFADPAFWIKLAALLAICVAGWFATPSAMRRLFAFCALAWVVALGPMLNVSLWTFPAYDRFEYMALPFLIVGAALIVEGLIARANAQAPSGAERSISIVWPAAIGLCALFGLARGITFASETDVMNDAALKSPENAYAWGQLANSLYPEWLRATQERRADLRRQRAIEIAAATAAAQKCWNFVDFYVTPVPLLVMTGQVLQQTGLDEQAAPFLEAALNEPRWSRFSRDQKDGRRTLALIALDFAQARILRAEAPQSTPDAATALAKDALKLVERSRELAGTSDSGFWWTYKAHQILARGFQQAKQTEQSDAELRDAVSALQQIDARSRLFPLATEALQTLKH